MNVLTVFSRTAMVSCLAAAVALAQHLANPLLFALGLGEQTQKTMAYAG